MKSKLLAAVAIPAIVGVGLGLTGGLIGCERVAQKPAIQYPYVEQELDLSSLRGLEGCRIRRVVTSPDRWVTVTRCASDEAETSVSRAPIPRRGTDPRQEPTGSKQ